MVRSRNEEAVVGCQSLEVLTASSMSRTEGRFLAEMPSDAPVAERQLSVGGDIRRLSLTVRSQSDPGAQHSQEDSPPLRGLHWPAFPQLLHAGGKRPAVVGVAAMASGLRWQSGPPAWRGP
jgi:hypothetical protein